MPRSIRLLEKKRGERRTGSSSAGLLGESVFYGFFLLLGVAGAAYLIVNTILPEWRANQFFVESSCRILDKHVGRQDQLGLSRFRPEIQIKYKVGDGASTSPVWTYDAANEYRFDEADAEAILADFEVGQEYVCWVDPQNPALVVLVRYRWWPWVLFVVAASFAVFGGVGLAYSLFHARTSAEWRLSHSKAGNGEGRRKRGKKKTPTEYPAVPSVRNIVNSPGTQLEYRLPIDASSGWRLFGIGVSVVLWNGLVAYFVFQAFRGHLRGEPNWLLTAVLLPFVAGGIWLAVAWIRQLLVTTGVGATRLEVDDHPLRPGETYAVCISQAGRMKINRLEVVLLCKERATYHQGTDTRSETQRVFENVVYSEKGFEIEPRAAFEAKFDITIPGSAMHSLITDHNEVAWALVVRGDIAHWPDFIRRFPVCIYPKVTSNEAVLSNDSVR